MCEARIEHRRHFVPHHLLYFQAFQLRFHLTPGGVWSTFLLFFFGRWFEPGFCALAGNYGAVAEKVSCTVAFKRSHLGPITNHRYIDRGKCLGVPLCKHAVGCACFICLNLIGS